MSRYHGDELLEWCVKLAGRHVQLNCWLGCTLGVVGCAAGRGQPVQQRRGSTDRCAGGVFGNGLMEWCVKSWQATYN
jgi:hypothetical protein